MSKKGEDDDLSSSRGEEEAGPSPFVLMDEIVEKLKLLNYEKDFLKKNSTFALQKPLNHAYFAIPHSNPNEQFFYLASLISYLMGVCGHQWQAPGQFDDPNATSASIVENLQRMSMSTDFAPSKLRAGHGETVCVVLMALVDKALKTVGFKLQKPQNVKEKGGDDDLEEEDPEDDEVEDDTIVDDDKEEDQLEAFGAHENRDFSKTLIESKIDPAEWKLEVERVAAQLGADKTVDQKDWRAHLEKMKTHQKSITEQLAAAQSQLDKMTIEITQTLEKIDTREKFLNTNFKNLAAEYKAAKELYTDTNDKYSLGSETVNRYTNELSKLQDELDRVKGKMEQASNQMTDTTPLNKIKTALEKLRQEIGQYEVRIGVVENSLLQVRIAQKKQANINAALKASGK
eukprot:TRINITY_DN3066_c0_g2_i3.p1 TRINITY_DN3066_c0_g2~~TRINITY_DN3066_c0_g2_i3.p1  ORF type:complete len:401 (-),score=186.76 TRINITY_DN3066_c0_g2_i3:388-1590(-)